MLGLVLLGPVYFMSPGAILGDNAYYENNNNRIAKYDILRM